MYYFYLFLSNQIKSLHLFLSFAHNYKFITCEQQKDMKFEKIQGRSEVTLPFITTTNKD